MKLYELQKGSTFTLKEQPSVPPVAPEGNLTKVYTLRNIDGMYSYVKDAEGNVYHFAAWTEVEKVDEAGKQVS